MWKILGSQFNALSRTKSLYFSKALILQIHGYGKKKQ